ncbi:hypothetical protein RRG08_054649 [Elysia crispata]|uniref:Uncharacterized protein n=1 Tax=Elysia crispata TaxID=231223 RepID=A0AAE1E9B0_9GAST|nr:hypothetical protein RRG08_054649 [Elysia crispata]
MERPRALKKTNPALWWTIGTKIERTNQLIVHSFSRKRPASVLGGRDGNRCQESSTKARQTIFFMLVLSTPGY